MPIIHIGGNSAVYPLLGIPMDIFPCYTIFKTRGSPLVPQSFCRIKKTQMKPHSYYQTTSVSIPRKDDYMTIYYYRKGVMVGMKVGKVDEDFEPPKNCVEEKVLDELSYNAHLKHYQEENLRLQEEFRRDLLEKYYMTNHPKANKIFNKAWDLGCSLGYREVEGYFQDLVELFKTDEDSTIDSDEVTFHDILSYDNITGKAIFN